MLCLKSISRDPRPYPPISSISCPGRDPADFMGCQITLKAFVPCYRRAGRHSRFRHLQDDSTVQRRKAKWVLLTLLYRLLCPSCEFAMFGDW